MIRGVTMEAAQVAECAENLKRRKKQKLQSQAAPSFTEK